MMKVFIILLIVSIVAIETVSAATPDSGHKRVVQYNFTLQNTRNTVLPKAEFWTYAPVKKTSFQECVGLKVSSPHEVVVDELGNQVLHFKFFNLPPFATKVISIRAELQMSSIPGPLSLESNKLFLAPEDYIQSDSPEIVNLSRKLIKLTIPETVTNIFQWVEEHLTYSGYDPNDNGALWALEQRKGDCTEFMYLFVALCRANNIPARGVGGYVCRKNSIVHSTDYHNWAEFYMDGKWRVADPSKRILMENEHQFIAMRILGGLSMKSTGNFHRFRFSGEGLKVRMK
jgi:hypothetical protein